MDWLNFSVSYYDIQGYSAVSWGEVAEAGVDIDPELNRGFQDLFLLININILIVICAELDLLNEAITKFLAHHSPLIAHMRRRFIGSALRGAAKYR